MRRNRSEDWDEVLSFAKQGDFDRIPSDILVRYYSSLVRIRTDFAECPGTVKEVYVFWGRTGSGKSRTAWEQAGMDAYSKDPLSKWWCGYKGERHVVIDEFRGIISIAHLLRWLDRYPVRVETKGGAVPFIPVKIWITSNLSPEYWFPDLDEASRDALFRRFTEVIEMN